MRRASSTRTSKIASAVNVQGRGRRTHYRTGTSRCWGTRSIEANHAARTWAAATTRSPGDQDGWCRAAFFYSGKVLR